MLLTPLVFWAGTAFGRDMDRRFRPGPVRQHRHHHPEPIPGPAGLENLQRRQKHHRQLRPERRRNRLRQMDRLQQNHRPLRKTLPNPRQHQGRRPSLSHQPERHHLRRRQPGQHPHPRRLLPADQRQPDLKWSAQQPGCAVSVLRVERSRRLGRNPRVQSPGSSVRNNREHPC